MTAGALLSRAQPMRPPLAKLYELLESTLGYQGWWPLTGRAGLPGYDTGGYRSSPETPLVLSDEERFEIAVGAILTQNTTWDNANRALKRLHDSNQLTAEKLLRFPQSELAALIRSCGYHNQKAKKLQLLAGRWGQTTGVRRRPGAMRERLLGIWGIGPETADSILLYAFDHPYFVVDAYARRVFTRVGIEEGGGPYETVQQLVHEELGREQTMLGELHALLVSLGKEFCKTRPLCAGCALQEVCATGRGIHRG